MATAPKTQYETVARGYASYDHLPIAKLEKELVTKAIGNCTELSVLDLGGGNGQYARLAFELGAELVDVLDISPAMLAVGIEAESNIGREGKIRWFEADATKALHHLSLIPGGYDIVMCNWLFDHATTDEVSMRRKRYCIFVLQKDQQYSKIIDTVRYPYTIVQELESMWRNASTQLKPGGKLVNVRATGLFDTDHVKSGKYGLTLSGLTSIPGGVRYQVTVHIDPPFEFEGTTLEASASLSNEINHRNGFADLEVLKPEDTEVVRSDEAFWKDFVEEPFCVVLTARKP